VLQEVDVMNQTRDVETREGKTLQERRAPDGAMLPPVDIFEDDSGITLQADMPGVARDKLDIRVDRDSLSITGELDIAVPEGMDALYADVRYTRYERSFALSRELDGDNVQASLKDGVLNLRIPKRAEHQPRKIEVRTD
jgi:HSP20 family molecular chaperone IbpA